jgi:hypothetical protein
VARTGRDRRQVARWIAAGRLKPILKLPGRTGAYLFAVADVDELCDELGIAS